MSEWRKTKGWLARTDTREARSNSHAPLVIDLRDNYPHALDLLSRQATVVVSDCDASAFAMLFNDKDRSG